MVKAAKAVKNNNTSQSSSSSSSATSSAMSSISAAASSCTPPTIRNGAMKNDRFFILNPAEQNALKKYVSEIKQISGLILLKWSRCPRMQSYLSKDARGLLIEEH